MTTRPSLISILKSNTYAIYIAIASVICQSFHTFFAFYKISSLNGTGWGIAQAVLFAIILDAAVLFYTVRKNTKVTWMAAFVMVLINLYVYYVHLGLTFDFILGVLISFVIPVSNYFYSEEITDDVEYEIGQRDEVLKIEKKYEDMIAKMETTIENQQALIEYEGSKAQKYISELRDSIKARDEVISIMKEHKLTDEQKDNIMKSFDEPYKSVNPLPKGFASLKSPAQEEQPPADKSLLGVDKIIATDRPNP
jgi:uncharacterized membrane protein YgaE (UPF0421/DUF939 family)